MPQEAAKAHLIQKIDTYVQVRSCLSWHCPPPHAQHRHALHAYKVVMNGPLHRPYRYSTSCEGFL
jgi:hypothetical protein